MVVRRTRTHFTMGMTAGELKKLLGKGHVLYLDEASVWWGARGQGVALMEADDYAWYAGVTDLSKLADTECLEVSYPRIKLDLGLDDADLAFCGRSEVDLGNARVELRVQEPGLCEKDLFERGFLPTIHYVHYDQVYARYLDS